jgi:hypothetical protein
MSWFSSTTAGVVLSLSALLLGVGAAGAGIGQAFSGWAKKLEYDPNREHDTHKAWAKLTTREILKKADPELKTYFLKEQEYALIVREFQSLKDATIANNDYTAMILVMNRLRASPFFDEVYRPEYDTLWLMLTQKGKKDGIKCAQLYKIYPEFKNDFYKIYEPCENDSTWSKLVLGGGGEGNVSILHAIEALERKLRN